MGIICGANSGAAFVSFGRLLGDIGRDADSTGAGVVGWGARAAGCFGWGKIFSEFGDGGICDGSMENAWAFGRAKKYSPTKAITIAAINDI